MHYMQKEAKYRSINRYPVKDTLYNAEKEGKT